jgi:Glycosyl transferase family 2.
MPIISGIKPSTVALNIIVKDEVEEVDELVRQASPFFDQINLTISDQQAFETLQDYLTSEKTRVDNDINIEYREWNNRFDDARNANYALSTCDYNFWLDADDEFDFRAIPKLVEIADQGQYGAIFLPYNYAQDEQGRCVVRHWRERLTRRSLPFEWRGWVHESQICDEPYTSHRVNVEVIHHASPEHAQESFGRNHVILLQAAAETHDPRYIHYLGMSFFTNKEYGKAIKTLKDYLEVGGSPEDIYRSLSIISECAYHLRDYGSAMEFAMKAAIMIPEYPMAYWLLAQYEADQENWQEGLEWVRTSFSKPDPDTLSIWDPTSRERAALIAARCEYMLGNFNAALAWLKKAPNSEDAQELLDDFLAEANKETFLSWLPRVVEYFDNEKSLWEALSDDIKYDKRLQQLRYSVTKPRQWDDKSITILCGEGYEEWGPHTLDKGMGGSEEAVVYLSRELAKLGWSVTVYGAVDKPVADMITNAVAVRYVPWRKFDPRDEFNVFVAWRAPQFAEKVNAKVKIADIHDVLPKEIVKNYPDITYFVKSKFHRDLYPDLKDDKFVIVGNGISKEQF